MNLIIAGVYEMCSPSGVDDSAVFISHVKSMAFTNYCDGRPCAWMS